MKQDTITELLAALDKVTAALESVMAWKGSEMHSADQQSREANITEARAAIAKAKGSQ